MTKHKRQPYQQRHFSGEPQWPAEDMGGWRWFGYAFMVALLIGALFCLAFIVALIWLVASLALSIGA